MSAPLRGDAARIEPPGVFRKREGSEPRRDVSQARVIVPAPNVLCVTGGRRGRWYRDSLAKEEGENSLSN